MAERGKNLADRVDALVQEMAAFVTNCSDEDWKKACPAEQWPVGVVARHMAAGHFAVLDLVKMIVEGTELPPITREAIDQANAEHAREHGGCTKEEVLDLLRTNGAGMTRYLRGLADGDLDRTGFLPATDGEVSAQQFVEFVLLNSGGEHLTSLKTVVG